MKYVFNFFRIRKTNRINPGVKILLGILMMGLAYVGGRWAKNSNQADTEGIAEFREQARQEIQFIDSKLNKLIENIEATVQDPAEIPWPENAEKEIQKLHESGINLIVFRDSLPVYWSDSRIVFEDILDSVSQGRNFFSLRNGWYLIEKKTRGLFTYVSLFLVKNEYAYQNRFLTNEFNPLLGFPKGSGIGRVSGEGTFDITDSFGKFIFSVDTHSSVKIEKPPSELQIFCYLLFFIFLLYVFILVTSLCVTSSRGNIGLLGISFFLIILRVFSIKYKLPHFLYDLSLFDPSHYASSNTLNSLGDFILNTFLIFYLIIIFRKNWKPSFPGAHRGKLKYFIAGSLMLLTLFAGEFTNHLLSGLVINSNISMSTANIFDLNSYSLYAFILVTVLFISLYMVMELVVSFVEKTSASLTLSIGIILMVDFVYMMTILIFRDGFASIDMHSLLFSNLLVGAIMFSKRATARSAYTGSFLIVFLFSVYASFEITEYNNIKERGKRSVLAGKLDKRRDFGAENLFADIGQKAPYDGALIQNFLRKRHTDRETELILNRNYFAGYWNHYDIKFFEFDLKGNAIWDTSLGIRNLEYFEKLIELQGSPTLSKNLYFINNSSGRTSYIGLLPVMNDKTSTTKQATIVIQIDSKFVQDAAGFPELSLSDKVVFSADFANYSYATYKNGSLISQHGDFPYSLSSAGFGVPKTEGSFLDKDGWNHFVYKTNESTLVVMSREISSWFDYLNMFSYVFALFGIFCVTLSLLIKTPFDFGTGNLNFKRRIQFSMLILVLVSLFIIGGGTVTYMIKKYRDNQADQITERITSLLMAIENQVNSEKNMTHRLSDDLIPVDVRLSGNTLLDYNVYGSDGRLIYSTQPHIFEQGIVSSWMNPVALTNLRKNQMTKLVQNENIGGLNFIAGYVPIRDNGNMVIGYLNLPYFSRESELKKEISGFLVALINYYVLLFAMAVAIALFISNRITKPLDAIRLGLAKIKLGSQNEQLHWKREDEIGALVTEFNRMVDELVISADKLARSERENAWREMAKQVAHEIKNPLTPMKLSIQHLQRAWKAHPENMDEMLERVSRTLITQIDTLSSIATSFSDFARMPKAQLAEINFFEIITGVYNLYKGTEGVVLQLKLHGNPLLNDHPNMIVLADAKQLSGAISNLMKNALQSIPEDRPGKVIMNIRETDLEYCLDVQDNGIGILPENMDKIFVPNFTTKTAGMGLGLAMVKNTIEQCEGKISFTTRASEGSVFTVCLPKLTRKD